MVEEVEVRECDKLAAREWNRDHGGCCDQALAIAFAAHRQQTVEQICQWLRSQEDSIDLLAGCDFADRIMAGAPFGGSDHD